MKYRLYICSLLMLQFMSLPCIAQNPIIQTRFTPDPAPYVHGDTIYLFVDHDEPNAQGYEMRDWLLYISTDMVNWTYRGTPLSPKIFSWARQDNDCWASQAVERNGKWYWYVAAGDLERHRHGIGVAVADRPEGPWHDPLGHPLIPGNDGYIDPSIFVDDDGQAYLCWGNSGLWYARLNDDMITLRDSIMSIDVEDTLAFGPHVLKHDHVRNVDRVFTRFEEAPWLYKYNGRYYLEYAAGGAPEHWAYSTADHPMGPWHFQGRIMDEAENSFTIHGGSIRIQGRNFMFYHNGTLTGGSSFSRASCVEEFQYNADGTIPFIPFTTEGVRTPLRNLNPYKRVEAETMADSRGLDTDTLAGPFHYVTNIDDGDWQRIRSIDWNRQSHRFTTCTRVYIPCILELRTDSPDGDIIGTVTLKPTYGQWKQTSTRINPPQGTHDLYIIYRAAYTSNKVHLLDFDWWQVQ